MFLFKLWASQNVKRPKWLALYTRGQSWEESAPGSSAEGQVPGAARPEPHLHLNVQPAGGSHAGSGVPAVELKRAVLALESRKCQSPRFL